MPKPMRPSVQYLAQGSPAVARQIQAAAAALIVGPGSKESRALYDALVELARQVARGDRAAIQAGVARSRGLVRQDDEAAARAATRAIEQAEEWLRGQPPASS